MNRLTLAFGAAGKGREKAGEQARAPKTRVQFDLSPRAMDRLDALKAKTEASSYAEVLRNALGLYEGLIEESEQGRQFLVRDKDGTVSPFRLFL